MEGCTGVFRTERPPVLASTLSALASQYKVPGAQVAVHENGRTAAAEFGDLAYGAGRPVTADAAFPVGSVTKSCTATLAMILVADGDLELDAPVAEYLPELGDLGDGVTVGRLLCHTSGLAADADSDQAATASRRRYVQNHCRRRLLIQRPGAGFSYSNLGYVLAGHLIETVTGLGWHEAMESVLLRPLGIEPAFVASDRRPGRPVATGHSVRAGLGRTRPVQQSLSAAEAPAGGLALSATDLVALASLHLAPGRPALLPAAAAQRMRRAVPRAEPFGIADGWALGLAVYRHGGTRWYGHDGNGNGTACYYRVDPVAGTVIAFTSNASTGYDMWQALLDELGRAGMPVGRYRSPSSGRPVPTPPGCLGSYANGDLEYAVTATKDGCFRVTVEGEVFDRIVCRDDLTFSLPAAEGSQQLVTGRFVLDPATGKVDGIQVGGRLARRQDTPARGNRHRLTA